jgi:nucleotide-binding universal stress UspA family protein
MTEESQPLSDAGAGNNRPADDRSPDDRSPDDRSPDNHAMLDLLAEEPESAAPAPEVEYILVALDLSDYSEAALAAAAELAAVLHLELRGLYVEDINLIHLCGLPFGVEYGSFTARPNRIRQNHLEREFRLQASFLRKTMADIAGQNRVPWSFQVVRGSVTDQLLEAASSARMLSLGRVGRSPGKRTGSTAQAIARRAARPVVFQSRRRSLHGPYTVLYSGTAAADRALALAADLSAQEASVLRVLVTADELAVAAGAALPPAYTDLQVVYARAFTLRELLGALQAPATAAGVVILPVESAAWLEDIHQTVIVVP